MTFIKNHIIELYLAVLDKSEAILIFYFSATDALDVSFNQSTYDSLLSFEVAVNYQQISVTVSYPSFVSIED